MEVNYPVEPGRKEKIQSSTDNWIIRKKMNKKRFMSLVLTAVIAGSTFAGCTNEEKPVNTNVNTNSNEPSANSGTADEPEKKSKPSGNLLDKVTAAEVNTDLSEEQLGKLNEASADWSLNLLRKCYKEDGGDSFVSPLSIELALSMTANGAANKTLEQMLTTMAGENCDINTLNAYLKRYTDSLENDDWAKLEIANAIWTNEKRNVIPGEDFLKNVKGAFDAGVYSEPFETPALDNINQFCKEKTDGQIEKVLEEINPGAIMYLVNALNFEANWADQYAGYQVSKCMFTEENGNQTEMDMMFSTENEYLCNDFCYGVKKRYESGYSFVALLPNEGETVSDLLEKMDGNAWMNMVNNPTTAYDVETKIPKFEKDSSYSLGDILQDMGMKDAFNEIDADFSNMIEPAADIGNIYISLVIHKAHIELTESGTKAAAVTVVGMTDAAAYEPEVKERKEVYLDRPFVYAIVDNENNLPIFIGTFDKP